MSLQSRKILFSSILGVTLMAVVIACAKQGLLHTSIAKPHQPAESLGLPLQEGMKRGTLKEGTGRGATRALEQAGKYLSERVVKFSDAKTLRRHFREHGKEIGAITVVEYETKAARFLSGPPVSGVLERARRNGDIVRYNPLTEEFGVAKLDGTIRTYFKPDPKLHGYPTNRAYFEAQ